MKSYTDSKHLEGLFSLPNKVAVFVPSTKYNEALSSEEHAEAVEMAVDDLTSVLGGTTSYKADGSYQADSGEVINEGVTVVTANCGDDSMELAISTVVALANYYKVVYKQEAVSIEVNGVLLFV